MNLNDLEIKWLKSKEKKKDFSSLLEEFIL